MTRHYLALIEEEPGKAVGVIVPDLPGCFSAGDTLDEAIENAQEAVALWLEQADTPPRARTLAELKRDPSIADLLARHQMLVAAIALKADATAA